MLFKKTKELLGTVVEISIVCCDEILAKETLEKSFCEIERIEKKFSRFIDGSELNFLNKNLNTWMEVDDEFFALLQFSKETFEKTNGFFDISVKEILEEWGYGGRVARTEIRELSVKTGKSLKIDLKNQKVKLNKQIEIGGFGKGYCLDRVAEILRNFENVFVNAGGDIFVKGIDENGKPWKVFFENPIDNLQVLGEVEIQKPLFLAASSASKRKWQDKHHLVNPIDKSPANEMLAVFTQGSSGIISDTYSTALFVMGYEKAKEFLINFSETEAMIISKEGKIWRTDGFAGKLYRA